MPCLWCLKGSWSPITRFPTFGIVGHGAIVVLGRIDGEHGWVGGTCGTKV